METIKRSSVILTFIFLLFVVFRVMAKEDITSISIYNSPSKSTKSFPKWDGNNVRVVRDTKNDDEQDLIHRNNQESANYIGFLTILRIESKLDSQKSDLDKCRSKKNHNSLLQKIRDVERNSVTKSELKLIQDNILRSVKHPSTPQGRCSDYTQETPKTTRDHLLYYLKTISGSRTISGVNIHVTSPTTSGEIIHDITGTHPGIWTANLHHIPEFILQGPSYIDEAISQWSKDSLVILQWFPCPPTLKESCSESDMHTVRYNTTEWQDLVTDGGTLNKLWKVRLNSMVVPFLKRLESAGVIVIFDPLILMNLPPYWWTGNRDVTGSRLLYQITHDYLTKQHNLNSIIWKWSLFHTADLETQMEDFWPGNEYVDVGSISLMATTEASGGVYQKMIDIVGDKPMGMEWLFSVPKAEMLKRQPRWTWFTVADNLIKNPGYNNDTDVQVAFAIPSVINRGGIDVFKKTNYALNRSATSSSLWSESFREFRAVDGNNATGWSSQKADLEWFQVDLGQIRFIKHIRIVWEHAHAKGYQLQTSEDKVAWKIVHEEFNGRGGVENILITFPLLARYVKMFGFKRGTGYGYHIYEFEIY